MTVGDKAQFASTLSRPERAPLRPSATVGPAFLRERGGRGGVYFPSSSAALRSLLISLFSLNCCCEQPSDPPGPIAEHDPMPDAPVLSVPCARIAQLSFCGVTLKSRNSLGTRNC